MTLAGSDFALVIVVSCAGGGGKGVIQVKFQAGPDLGT